MVVNIIKDEQMFSMTLPSKVKGQYWILDLDSFGKSRKLISIEAVDGEWIVKSNKTAWVLNSSNEQISNTILKTLSFFNIKIKNSDEKVLLFSEPINNDRQTFKKIIIKEACELTIGRTQQNSICFENKFVSGNHSKLVYDGNNWSIIDLNSTNGTFVNSFRIATQALNAGDLIYIMGLKIVIGNQYIAINNPDNNLIIKSQSVVDFIKQEIEPASEREDIEETSYFFRSPRFKREIDTAEIKIDPPPALQKIDQVPLALMLGPSITMGLTSLSTGLLTLSNVMNSGGNISTAMPTLFMSFSMLLGTIMWPILTKRHEKKARIANEQKRQVKYLAYLDSIRDEIKRRCKDQTEILNENLISNEECSDRIINCKRNLWERSIGQNDFMKLRVGIGNLPLDADVRHPEKKFTMDDDNLQDALFSLSNEPKVLINVPVSISLTDNNIVGIIGNRSNVVELTQSLILQTVALHSYDEVKLVIILDKDEEKEWEFSKYIPHIWNNDKTERYYVTDSDEIKELSMLLEKNIVSRLEDGKKKFNEYSTYYLIVSASKELADKCESLVQLIKAKENKGYSIITLYDEINNLPKETSNVIEVDAGQSKIFDKDDTSGKSINFTADKLKNVSVNEISECIANIQMDLSSQRFALPNMVTFLEMFNVGKIEHLNSLTRWKENNPTITLQTPIGVDTQGESFFLDLHEKYHGPHGLVAGMTGSGKSEFIITYILSLAVNFHPDEVAFILIDYKGGGLTGAFENTDRGIKLPHLAGTITNLDGAAVKRSLISIQSELRRRQAIFNDARKKSNEGTMDIYKYQQLYREKVVDEPIPHLFIISDEFAELKTQQPEFMEQLISAARIGRSLGVHLILATQKPSGVVDDQIWSNSKFRVCLKVQEKADSMDMIKCSDAAELSQTGRFYLQVGFNELFALGQSAWCGASYYPTETVEKNIDSSIQVIDSLGRVIKEAKPAKKVDLSAAKTKQIVSIVKYLSDLSVEEKIKVRPLWLDPIPALIYIGELERKYKNSSLTTVLNPIVGEYDDPFNQRQSVLTLPLSREGNSVIFGSTGNGKTTFLTTLLYSLIKNHESKYLNLYIMDFGSETLRAFEKAPQVGGVLFSHNNEEIINLFKMLQKELEKRKSLFSNYGGDYASYCKNSGEVEPNIVVVLNNYSNFAELYEDLVDDFDLLTRDGLKYGIHFIVTASHTNAIRYRTLQNFKQLITLQLNDASDYSTIVGKTEGLIPSRIKGRGLVNLERVYEFQTAHCNDCDDQFEFIRGFCQELKIGANSFAKRIPVLPKLVNLDAFTDEKIDINHIPIGISKKALATIKINIKNKYIHQMASQETYQLQSFVQGLADVVSQANIKTTVWDVEQLLAEDALKKYEYLTDDFEKQVGELFADIVSRNNAYKDSNMDSKALEKYDTNIYFIIGLKKLFDKLSEDGKDKLKVILEKGETIYKVHFVLAETANIFNSYSFDTWYKQHISGSDGIWIGDGFADQYIIKPSKVSSELYDEIGDEFGYAVNRGKPTLLKLLTSKSSDWEDENNE